MSLRIRTTSTVWKLEDPDGSIAEYLRSGGSLEDLRVRSRVVEVKTSEGNVILDEGANYIWRLVTGEPGLVPFNAVNSYVGVGDGTAPASPAQTGLQGASKYYRPVDSGFPKAEGRRIIFRATFGPDEANFTWNEWTVANGSSDTAVNLNRKVEYLGSKAPGSTWVIQVALEIS